VEDPSFGRLLTFETDVLEVAGVPQGVEVALKSREIVDIANVGENAGLDSVGGDASVAMNSDADYQILLCKSG
jgi:hypothetical protein